MTRPEERNGAGGADAQPTRRDPEPRQPPGEPAGMDTAQHFGRFELLLEMARGGMATLFLARLRGPEGFEKLVALKRIHEQLASEEQFTEMFLDEARIAAKIHHPNVATVFDMGRVADELYLAMEYIHGEPLHEVIRNSILQGGGLECHHALRIVADAAAGLHAAHELTSATGEPLGVVHRDVSPQNILLSYDGHVKVVDFGIAYAAERLANTSTGTIKGKAAYMSPEQAMAGPVDRRSDIFSLGIVLWELVLGQRLFRERSESATLLRIRDGDIPKPRSIDPELPAPVEQIIFKALAYQPGDRYQTAAKLFEALDRELFRQKRYVSAVQIGEMMTELCAEEKRVKDERIQLASHSAAQQLLGATDPSMNEPALRSDGSITIPDPIPHAKPAGESTETAFVSEIATELITGQTLDTIDSEDTITRLDTQDLRADRYGGDAPPIAEPAPGNHHGLLLAASGVGAIILTAAVLLLLSGARDTPLHGPAMLQTAATDVSASAHADAGIAAPRRAIVQMATDAATSRSRPAWGRRDRVNVRVLIRPADSKPVISFVGKQYAGSHLDIWVPRAHVETTLVITAPGYVQETIRINLERDVTLKVPLQRARASRRTPVKRHTGPRKRTTPMAADLVKTY